MASSLQSDIPDFLIDSIVYWERVNFKRDERSYFVLAKNLRLYELRQKHLRHFINLDSCLSSLKENILNYDEGNTSSDYNVSQAQLPKNIILGKYIYRHFDINKFYLLLRCWSKFIIINHDPLNGMKLIAEYDNVNKFKIIPNPVLKYQALVQIHFNDGNVTNTDFQEHQTNVDKNAENRKMQRSEFKHLLDRTIRSLKSELQLHKEITQKEFLARYNVQHFGNNFVRSSAIEEKCMLSKCGDLWMRITANDQLVIGLPLVNNCAAPNLTILKNLHPVLNINGEGLEPNSKTLHFEHQLYQLGQQFNDLETLETVFQSEDSRFQENTWLPVQTQSLLPNAFIVLLLKFELTDLLSIVEKCQLFIRFEVEKDLETIKPKKQLFSQHLFIKEIDFQKVLQQRTTHEISFEERTIHQDFLAIAMTSYALKLRITFATSSDFEKFQNLLAKQFDLNTVHRKDNQAAITLMEINDIVENSNALASDTLFYNCKPNSLWFGSLVLRSSFDKQNEFEEDTHTHVWSFYNKNEQKTLLMTKLLFDDIVSIECNITSLERLTNKPTSMDTKIIHFENVMREELNELLELYRNVNTSQNLKENYEKFFEYQLQTDLLQNDL